MDTLLGEGTLLPPLSIADGNLGITCRLRAESRVGLKGIKYGTAMNTIEDMAFGDGGVSGSI